MSAAPAGEPSLGVDDVSARLERLPFCFFHVRVLIVGGMSLLFDALDSVITALVLAALRPIWRFDVFTIGLVAAVGRVGYMFGSLGCGWLSDRIGRKRAIQYTLFAYSLFSAARGLANDVTTFAVLNFFAFAFIGGESSIVPPYLAELWPSRVRGKLNGWVMTFFGLGIALAPVWALLVIPRFGWRGALLLTGPFAALGGAIRFVLPESPRWLWRTGKHRAARAVMASIETQVERSIRGPLAPVTAVAASPGPPLVRVRALLGRRYRAISLMLWTAWFAEFGVLHTFQTYIPTLLESEGHSIVKSFQHSAVIYAAVIPGYAIGGRIVEWLDRKYAILAAFLAAAFFGTLFGISTTASGIMLYGALSSFALAIGSTAVYTYTPELYPTEVRATAMGIASAWGRLGTVTLLLAFGTQIGGHDKSLLLALVDSVLVIAALAVVVWGPSTRSQQLEALG